jgi:hypothetical protein
VNDATLGHGRDDWRFALTRIRRREADRFLEVVGEIRCHRPGSNDRRREQSAERHNGHDCGQPGSSHGNPPHHDGTIDQRDAATAGLEESLLRTCSLAVIWALLDNRMTSNILVASIVMPLSDRLGVVTPGHALPETSMLASELWPIDDAWPGLRVQLLGGFQVALAGQPIDPSAWNLRKSAVIVKLLALEPTRQLHIEQLMEQLWPDAASDAASNNLRRTLYVARRILGQDRQERPQFLQRRGETLVLGPLDTVVTDVDIFIAAAATARGSEDPGASQHAIELYGGELLPDDRYEDWAD